MRKNIERAFRRRTGMSANAITDMHTRAANEQWWVRCWNCRTQNTGKPAELKTCNHCGVNLWSRDDASSS